MKEKKGRVCKFERKCLSLVLALTMVLGLVAATGVQAYAEEASYGYTTDANGIMAYKEYTPNENNGYDFIGYVDGEWQQVTLAFRGFMASTYNGRDSLQVSAQPTFVADGKAIQMKYTVTNTGSEDVADYRFFVAADTAVANNDASSNEILDDNQVVMTSGNVSFFTFSTMEGFHPVATEYNQRFENCSVSYNDVIYGADPSTVTPIETANDSAAVMYFDKDTLSAGEAKTYSIIFGLGDSSTVKDIIDQIKKALSASLDYQNEAVNVGGSGTYEITISGDDTTYTFDVSEDGMIPLTGNDASGKAYDFIGKTISVIHKGDDTTGDGDPVTLDVASRPAAPDSSEASDVEKSEGQITVAAKEGCEYSIDGTNWVRDDDKDGVIVFSGLDKYKSYTISYRVYATDSNPVSDIQTMDVDPFVQKTDGPAAPSGLVATAPTTSSGTDGQISGVDETMEYSIDGGVTWVPVSGTKITGLAEGVSVTIRVKETEDAYAGASAEITVPEYSPKGDVNSSINYRTHVQTYGWESEWSKGGETSGTTGQSKRLEGIEIKLDNAPYKGSVVYRTHVQTYGWESEWKEDGETSGTTGEAKRLEAIEIKLTGKMAEKYDIYYRVHSQTYGWLDWAKNGEPAGTEGYAKRLEGIEIKLVKKGGDAPGSTTTPYVTKGLVSYQTHVQTYGWQDLVYDGTTGGTVGQAKRLEGIKIDLANTSVSGDICYRTHVQTYGWENKWAKNGDLSGTTGKAKRLEAIQIKLTGEMAEKYDIYYRTHVQKDGWLGWAKNGESAGTAGYAKRLEGIQIVLVPKGNAAPGSTQDAFKSK